jgi:hypothetical protein
VIRIDTTTTTRSYPPKLQNPRLKINERHMLHCQKLIQAFGAASKLRFIGGGGGGGFFAREGGGGGGPFFNPIVFILFALG